MLRHLEGIFPSGQGTLGDYSMLETIYVVTAYRFGDREKHSYVIGAYSDSTKAELAGREESRYRAYKYGFEVVMIPIDKWFEESPWLNPSASNIVQPEDCSSVHGIRRRHQLLLEQGGNSDQDPDWYVGF